MNNYPWQTGYERMPDPEPEEKEDTQYHDLLADNERLGEENVSLKLKIGELMEEIVKLKRTIGYIGK